MDFTGARATRRTFAALVVATAAACATQTEATLESLTTTESVGGSAPEGTGGSGASGMMGAGGSTPDPTLGTGGTDGSGATTGGTLNQSTGGSDSTGGVGGSSAGRSAGMTGGRAGRTGMTGAGGAGARAGATGMTGRGGGATADSGCAKLSVPLNAAADKAHFVTSLTTPADLSRATISMRYYVEAGSGGVIFNYVQDSSNRFLGATMRTALDSSAGAWNTITWDVGAEAPGTTGITKSAVKRIGIEVNASGSTTWTNPTVILVDSITVTTPARSFSFDAASSVSTMPASTDMATQALWLNSNSTDTTAARTALSWQASCP